MDTSAVSVTTNKRKFHTLFSVCCIILSASLSLFFIYFIVDICKYHNFFPLVNETEYDPSIDEVLLGMYTDSIEYWMHDGQLNCALDLLLPQAIIQPFNSSNRRNACVFFLILFCIYYRRASNTLCPLSALPECSWFI